MSEPAAKELSPTCASVEFDCDVREPLEATVECRHRQAVGGGSSRDRAIDEMQFALAVSFKRVEMYGEIGDLNAGVVIKVAITRAMSARACL